MRKTILGIIFLICIQSTLAQETFVKKYTSMITIEKYAKGKWVSIDLTVVFNEEGKRTITFYYLGGKTIKFHQISNVSEDKTSDGLGYQLIECIDQDGNKVQFQLFDDDTCLRLLISPGYFIEFHND